MMSYRATGHTKITLHYIIQENKIHTKKDETPLKKKYNKKQYTHANTYFLQRFAFKCASNEICCKNRNRPTRLYIHIIHIQSTLVISKSEELSEILRYIHTSTYQICKTEEKINRTTTFSM